MFAKTVIEVLRSQGFLEKLLLLVATAVLTGLLVPELSARLAESRNREQKVFEAELQRQRDVISAQSELLRSLSKVVWEFQLMNIDVSFYKVNGNEAQYTKAAARYQEQSAKLLGQIRAELSTARRLTSPAMHEKLRDLYFKNLLPIDVELELLIKRASTTDLQAWNRQHQVSFGATQTAIEDTLNALAEEFQLTASKVSGKGA